LLDLAETFGYVSPQTRQFLDAAIQISNLAQNAGSVGGGEIVIGSFRLDDLRTSGGLSSRNPIPIDALGRDLIGRLPDIKLPAGASKFQQKMQAVPTEDPNGKGLEFPILQDPLLIFNLLLGKAVDLFTYDMPKLDFNFEYSQVFPTPVPFVFVSLNGRIAGEADFDFGFDTSGLQRFVKTGRAADVFTGFFVDDHVSGGADAREMRLEGSLTVTLIPPPIPDIPLPLPGASVEVDVAVGGGVFLTVDFDVNYPNEDGRINFDELTKNLRSGPEYIFDITGDIRAKLFVTAQIEAVAKVKLGFKKITKSFTIVDESVDLVDVKLYEFAFPAPSYPEDDVELIVERPATLVGGVLTLNSTDDDDHFVITPDGVDGLRVTRSNGGLTETFIG
ncbi:MAG: hypothetical protein ACKOU6_02685, partial [Planctomycetota bacterium]